MQISKKRVLIISFAFLLLGIAISSFWHSLHNPMKPLYVELLNGTEAVIPSVIIEHGSGSLQEKITVVQLKPKESRVIALNHKPGMGFNVLANFCASANDNNL